MSAQCPHCGNDLGSYLVLTADGYSFRSYWCQNHGDVVPRIIDDGDREQGDLPDVQDDLQYPQNIFGRDGYHLVPESKVPSEA